MDGKTLPLSHVRSVPLRLEEAILSPLGSQHLLAAQRTNRLPSFLLLHKAKAHRASRDPNTREDPLFTTSPSPFHLFFSLFITL